VFTGMTPDQSADAADMVRDHVRHAREHTCSPWR
jgi:hypothetical protein